MQRYSLIIQIQVLRSANLGTKKKETLPKDLDRMPAAHLAVESIESEVQECKTKFNTAKKQSQRKLFTYDYKRKKVLLVVLCGPVDFMDLWTLWTCGPVDSVDL